MLRCWPQKKTRLESPVNNTTISKQQARWLHLQAPETCPGGAAAHMMLTSSHHSGNMTQSDVDKEDDQSFQGWRLNRCSSSEIGAMPQVLSSCRWTSHWFHHLLWCLCLLCGRDTRGRTTAYRELRLMRWNWFRSVTNVAAAAYWTQVVTPVRSYAAADRWR